MRLRISFGKKCEILILISLLLVAFLSTVLILGCSSTTQPVQTTTTNQMTTTNPITTAPTITTTQTTTTQTNPVTTIIPKTAHNNEPAIFTVSDLHVEPEVIASDEFFSIVFTVNNTGNGEGIYDAAIDITQIVGAQRIELGTLTKSVMVAAGESKMVTYDEMHLPEGDYEAVIDGLLLLFFCT